LKTEGRIFGSRAVLERSLFFANLAEISLRPLRSKALKALHRKVRKGIARGAKKITCNSREYLAFNEQSGISASQVS
jgi:hypothetical protein